MISNRLAVKRSSIILLLMIPGLYVSDILYGVLVSSGATDLSITPGIIIRGGIFVASLFISLRFSRYIGKGLFLYCWSLFFISIVGPAFSVFENLSLAILLSEVKWIAKVMYAPFCLLFFVVLIKRYKIHKNEIIKYIEYTAYFVGGALLAMQMLDIGGLTYGDYAYGSKGIFIAQNDFSLTLAIALSAAVYRNLTLPSFKRIILLIVSMGGFTGIGTRASLISSVVVPVTVLIVVIWAKREDPTYKSKRNLRKSLMFIVASLILLIGLGLSYRGYLLTTKYDFQAKKLESLVVGKLPRLRIITSGAKYLGSRNSIYDVFGEGNRNYMHGVYQYWYASRDDQLKMVEVDWMDFFGAYGFIFTAMIYGLFIILLLGSAKRFLFMRGGYEGLLFIMLSLYIGHSVLAGHALASPIVSTLIAAASAAYLCNRVRPETLQGLSGQTIM